MIKMANGRRWIIPSTPSCCRALENLRHDLMRIA